MIAGFIVGALLHASVSNAGERPYSCLSAPASLLSPHVARMASKRNLYTLGDVRRHLGRALIYGTYPLKPQTARRMRQKIAEWNMPDHLAVLTRAELEFADRLRSSGLNHRALNFLSDHKVRTFEQLRALEYEPIGLEHDDTRAREGLARLAAPCQATLDILASVEPPLPESQ